MNILLLVLSLIVFPTVIGCGTVNAYRLIKKKLLKADSPKRESAFCSFCVYFSTGTIIILAISGLINALAVFTNATIHAGSKYFALATTILSAISTAYIFIRVFISKKNKKANEKREKTSEVINRKFIILSILAGLFALIQCISIVYWYPVSYSGDQTLETVVSFVNTDQIYSVDPLTGLPYLNGYPFRLALQCLPFLYSVLCRLFSVVPSVLVWKIMPVFWLLCGYCSIYRIGDSLFKKNIVKLMMLVIYEFLLWCCDAASGATGFNIFHLGFNAVVVLELLLIYWTLGSIISNNSFAALLAVATEPLVASTKYGVGACFFMLISFLIIGRIPYVKRIISSVKDRTGGHNGKA